MVQYVQKYTGSQHLQDAVCLFVASPNSTKSNGYSRKLQRLKEQVRIVNKRDSNREKKIDNIKENNSGLIVLPYIEGMTEQ